MKKLTAGIFATLLAVVSVDGAYAAIASKGYVDDQVGEVQTTVAGKADKATTLSGYGITDAYTSAQGTALEGRVSAVEEPKAQVAADVTGPVSGGAVYTAIQGVSGDVSGVTSDVGTLKTEMAQAKEDISALETASATHATKTELTDGLATKQDKLSQTGSASQPVYVNEQGVVTAGNTIPSVTTNIATGQTAAAQAGAVADLLAGKVDDADLEDYVTETEANEAYAVKTLEGQVGIVSKENMGTTNATTVVGGVKEAIDAAKAADTKAGQAATAATGAQSAVDAVESIIGGYGDIVTHDASEFATADQGAKADTAVQPAAISDMLTKTEAGTTYYTKTSGDALAGRVTTAEGEIDAIQAEMDTMATSETVTNLTNRVTTAEGDIDDLEAAVNDAESGLAATNTIADEALANAATAQEAAEAAQTTATKAQTTANAALPKATYDSQVGTVTAGNMGTTATTVVAAIKEAVDEAAAAQSTASSANTAAGTAQKAAEAAQATANAAIPKPSGECSNPANKCVLTFNNSAYAWEVIERGAKE